MTFYNRSAVVVLHKPTGTTAGCISDRSQHRNKAKALNLLRARLWAADNVPRSAEVVRTYNGEGEIE